MATDRSLATLLRALQQPRGSQDSQRLLASATTLLTLLSNPLNVTLLSSQLLSAPALWHYASGLRTSLSILSVFHSASVHLERRKREEQDRGLLGQADGLAVKEWATAIAKGADERSPTWRHLLVLGGLLIGLEGRGQSALPTGLRRALERAVVTAANAALEGAQNAPEPIIQGTVCLVMGHVLDVLHDHERKKIRHDLLLPVLMRQIFCSDDGLQSGYFLGMIDRDIQQMAPAKFSWSPQSASFSHLQRMAKGPLTSALGSLARLAGVCIETVADVGHLVDVSQLLMDFTRSLNVQWQQNKLSELDKSEETEFLDEETLRSSLPLLWQTLRVTMFAIVAIERCLFGRLLGDNRIPQHDVPPTALQALHTLRNIYFISSRLGHNSFSQHTFTFMTAIDILTSYPDDAEVFLNNIRPRKAAHIPEHPYERCQNLFFFNVAEHFAACLRSVTNGGLIYRSAEPYLGINSDSRLSEIFEAAHSVVLAVFLAPHNHQVTAEQLPIYLKVLIEVFPQNLSARQFRLAIKTLIRIASPPSLIFEEQPLLGLTILEMVRDRAHHAPEDYIRPRNERIFGSSESTLSEKAVMILTLIDSLPVMPIESLQEWLPLVAECLELLHDPKMREACVAHFWDVLSNGGMNVPKAELCVAWWNMFGGRAMLMSPDTAQPREYHMSGALQDTSKL